IAALSAVKPDEDLELESKLVGVVARLGEIAAPAAKRHVVRAALEQTSLEVPRQPLPQSREVLTDQLLLQGVCVRRYDHPLAMADGSRDRRHQVGQALAGTGACLDQQAAAPTLDLRHREEHLHLRFAVLVAREKTRQRALG